MGVAVVALMFVLLIGNATSVGACEGDACEEAASASTSTDQTSTQGGGAGLTVKVLCPGITAALIGLGGGECER